jgi:uncharacterized protein YndB with AHSA1/START domain
MNRPDTRPERTPEPIVETVQVDAPPDVVWRVVSDVTRMGEWSPECRKVLLLGGRPALGARLLGINRRGLAVWPTMSTIVRFEPGRAVAWKTRQSGATWTYELEPVEGGTRLSGRRDLDRYTTLTRFAAPLIGGAAGHDRELAAGIRTTLQRIGRAAESSGRATAQG